MVLLQPGNQTNLQAHVSFCSGICIRPPLPFKLNSSRTGPGQANQKRLSNIGRVYYDDCREERPMGALLRELRK